jgi:CHAD domain-containing protein
MKKIKKKDLLHISTLKFLDKISTPYKNKTQNEDKENGSIHTLIQLFEILLSDINVYRKKLLAGGNDEDLHQFRIACRRSIVLMGEFKFLYGEESLLEHRKGLKNLISISNDKRDMDVLISELSMIEVSHYQDVLYLLKERVEKKIIIEHDTIMDYLKSEACINILVAWKNYITDMNRTYISIYGKYSIEVLSKYVIFQRFLKIKNQIKLLAPKHDASETLHKLRI